MKSYEAIIRGQWKLLQNDPYSPLELYNLQDYPQEKTNVAAIDKKLFDELAIALRGHIKRGGATPWQKRIRPMNHTLQAGSKTVDCWRVSPVSDLMELHGDSASPPRSNGCE